MHSVEGRVMPVGWRSLSAIAAAVAGLTMTAGCGSESSTQSAGGCTDQTAASEQNADEKYLTVEITKRKILPAGICLSEVDATDLIDQPGRIKVRFELTAPSSVSIDDLRPAATDLAHFLKKTPLIFIRTTIMEVTNEGYPKAPYKALLTDTNFQNNPWNGTPSLEAELAQWVTVDLA
ncbi:hypothetical protein [Nocardia sp. NPDC051832]|uniref:hypothetical protein n=1 Tax=Nocardia sp. NPDC051832 TaxID=3155673 RepID=UPI00343AC5AB